MFHLKGFIKTNLQFFSITCLLIFGFEKMNSTKKAEWQPMVLNSKTLFNLRN
jgi:hypothetical protein